MNTDPGRPGKFAARALILPALVLGLAACSNTVGHNYVSAIPDDYRVAHPIKIDEKLQTMDVPVGLDTKRLTNGVRGNVAGFGRRFDKSGSAVMAIVVPSGSPNEVIAVGASHQIRDVLIRAGVAPAKIDFRSYAAGPNETNAPIRLAYAGLAASVEGCGKWPDRLERNPANRNYANFGCATQSNLAAMIDNPLDLVYPRDVSPADAARRSAALEKYRAGESYTSGQQLGSGQIVQGVGN